MYAHVDDEDVQSAAAQLVMGVVRAVQVLGILGSDS